MWSSILHVRGLANRLILILVARIYPQWLLANKPSRLRATRDIYGVGTVTVDCDGK